MHYFSGHVLDAADIPPPVDESDGDDSYWAIIVFEEGSAYWLILAREIYMYKNDNIPFCYLVNIRPYIELRLHRIYANMEK